MTMNSDITSDTTNPMIQAAIDTSCGSALALKRGDGVLFSGRLDVRGRRSDAELMPWILNAVSGAGLSLADIRRWTVGVGPGSFSGVRVGIAMVKGICAGTRAAYRGLPSSLGAARSVVSGVRRGGAVCVLHDGRRGQLIRSVYRVTAMGLTAEGDPLAVEPGQLVVDTPCDRYVTIQPEEVLPLLDAAMLLDPPGWPWPESLPEAEAGAEPIYVRPPVFVKPRRPRHIRGAASGKE
jgi:tRNA threonylcarbamoyl adenosine modification protein YeaZ